MLEFKRLGRTHSQLQGGPLPFLARTGQFDGQRLAELRPHNFLPATKQSAKAQRFAVERGNRDFSQRRSEGSRSHGQPGSYSLYRCRASMINNPPFIAPALLAWYDRHQRRLPWRALPGEPRDPYRIWLSEIMLQQTGVATVIPYFERFISIWPNVRALTAAPLDHILREWAGLGYYARARNLHACARSIVADWQGEFPRTYADLLSLTGIGPYTAGAIAAIAYDLPHAAVDGNVERVVARLAALATSLPAVKPEIRRLIGQLVPAERAGDFAQALMDLGAMICTPANPKCLLCPLKDVCAAYASGEPARYPLRLKKAEKSIRYGHIFWLENRTGAVYLRRRPDQGLLGGMMEFPSTEWLPRLSKPKPPWIADWQTLPGVVRHTFTHFHLELIVHRTVLKENQVVSGLWLPPSRFVEIALPTLMRKVVDHVQRL